MNGREWDFTEENGIFRERTVLLRERTGFHGENGILRESRILRK